MNVLIWLVIALAAGIIEACTTALVSVWIVIGAVCAACVSALGGGQTVHLHTKNKQSLPQNQQTAPHPKNKPKTKVRKK